MDTSVLCIYCNHKERGAQTIEALLSSLVRQFIDDTKPVPSWIGDYYKDHTKLKKPRTTDGLKALLTTHLATSRSKVFVLVDAFDECDPVVQKELFNFMSSLPDSISIMVTSRPNPAMDTGSWTMNSFEASPDDMEKYIERRLEASVFIINALHESVQGNATPSLTRQTLIKRVLSHANGM